MTPMRYTPVALSDVLENAGCPLAHPAKDKLQFEELLAELSASFVNLPASQVDDEIEKALGLLVEFLGVDRGGFAELLIEQKQLVITHSYHRPGVPPNPRTILDEQLPWYAQTIRQGSILRLRKIPEDLPVEAVLEKEYCTKIGMKSHVMIPLKLMDAVIGAIGFAAFHDFRDWPDELVQRLRLVGEIFTNALARKRTDEALQAREGSLHLARQGLQKLAAKLLHAQEEERRRIAREMHDDWTQRLALLGIDIANLEKHIECPEQALPLLQAMQEKLVDLSKDVHSLSRQLHPSILDDLGLVEALRSECASFSHREGISVEYCAHEIPSKMSNDVALIVYRVAQEALRNVAKHAKVKRVTVTLNADAANLILSVRDKGIGFDKAQTHFHAGLGLCSMEERLHLIQGNLSITSLPKEGTTIEAFVPLDLDSP
jgi:two-component system, NarL family, sensor kinase